MALNAHLAVHERFGNASRCGVQERKEENQYVQNVRQDHGKWRSIASAYPEEE